MPYRRVVQKTIRLSIRKYSQLCKHLNLESVISGELTGNTATPIGQTGWRLELEVKTFDLTPRGKARNSRSLFSSFAYASASSSELISRQNPANASSSSTFLWGDAETNITVSVQTVAENGDLFVRMSAPATYSYFGVGIGNGMNNAVMFIAYSEENGQDIILSARTSKSHVEPVYSAALDAAISSDLPPNDPTPNGIRNGTYFLSFRLPAFASSSFAQTVAFDPSSNTQSFLFALGSPNHIPYGRFLNKNAPLRQHNYYGRFSVDMPAATAKTAAQGGFATFGFGTQMKGAAPVGEIKKDKDRASAAHGILMILAFLVVFPSGVLVNKLFGKVKIHAGVQTLGLVIVIVGVGVGGYVSSCYNRSNKARSPHQIIGIIILIALLAQFALGILHHRSYMKNGMPTKLLAPHKKYLGPLVILAGLVNTSIGFRFALTGYWNIIFVPLVLLMVFIVLGAGVVKRFVCGRRQKNREGKPMGTEQLQPPGFVPGQLWPQQPLPTAGGTARGVGGGDVELQRWETTESRRGDPPGYDLGMQPTAPRQMV
ncbi:hypothetical protein K402DRAFT_457213 [Aulographum hederae CBS 113979]|uniref:DOMON domain-containing protein n=1 Tax=Aulographum hederae CBS 113979 TaxID=1176131 RepID=A0A6G1GP52_9PEZI|nr:hypothetical protein K402DRAFT_457213 [Aulographum hederae CBS 113979]